MMPGDLIVTTHVAYVASWYPGMIIRSHMAGRLIPDGEVMILLSVHSTTVMAFSGTYGFVPFYIYVSGHQSFEAVK